MLVVAALITVAAAAVAIWLVVRRALRPLRELTATADEVGRSPDRGRRLPPARRQDDVGRLTASFNGMLDRLEEAHRRTTEAHQRTAAALAAQQRFAADASHELRTPLTTIRNNAGFLRAHPEADEQDRGAALADLEAESVRMSRLVDDLLTLARGDGGAPANPSTVDLDELAHEVCRTATAQHPDRRLHCAGAPSVLRADADALTRLLWILLDNAVRHTGPDGNIWIAVTRPARAPRGCRSPTTARASRRAISAASSTASTRPSRPRGAGSGARTVHRGLDRLHPQGVASARPTTTAAARSSPWTCRPPRAATRQLFRCPPSAR